MTEKLFNVEFVVDKVELSQVFLPVLRTTRVSIIPPLLHTLRDFRSSLRCCRRLNCPLDSAVSNLSTHSAPKHYKHWHWKQRGSGLFLTAGLHKFSKRPEVTSNCQAPEWWHEASFVLTTHNIRRYHTKFSRPGDLCILAWLHDYVWLTYAVNSSPYLASTAGRLVNNESERMWKEAFVDWF